jgi:putative FmdB family regulatory protein
MPVYEYECPACEKVIEVQQRISDDPLSTCPECGGEVKKLVSMSSFHLKGGGWYSDGYSSASNGNGGNGSNGGGKTKPVKEKPAKETTTTPSCQAGDSGSCKNCPAAT